ncbi:MAG: peptide chain release factor 1, partial [Acidimicrobiaceae bacterium]|nr:peptide chain release factor 1 [Acidimicrobiaceae bacterium]
MLERLEIIERDYLDLESSMATPDVLENHDKLRDVSRRYKQMTPLVECIRKYQSATGNAQAARELLFDASGVERDQLQAELNLATITIDQLENELKVLLLPADPNAGKNIIVEIRGAEGGEEANLFASDLFDMYKAFAVRNGWSVEVLSLDLSPKGGINQVVMIFKGETAWTRMRFEGGPHRVQRVPATESQGRIHTSSATVMVLPEVEEVELQIDEKDLQIDVYRASGPGGQGVNTTDSAVRITHRPSGVVVAMQDERSQLQNRLRAMQVLRARLLKRQEEESQARASAERKAQVGGGGRGEKIRTYNFKDSRVTDHRIGFTLHQLQEVLAGNLDPVIDALTL